MNFDLCKLWQKVKTQNKGYKVTYTGKGMDNDTTRLLIEAVAHSKGNPTEQQIASVID
jgi:NADPH-dependent ferric siderophore reductase